MNMSAVPAFSHAAGLTRIYEGWDAQCLSVHARAVAKMGILDILGCIVAGASTPAASRVRAWAQEQSGGAGTASVLGTDAKLSASSAALANAVAGHALDYDDMNSTLTGHPSVVLVPTLLALAEIHGASGRALLEAYMLGFEVNSHFGRTMVPRHYEAGWHTTSSIGILGAAAAASRLLGLGPDEMLNALAIAASNVAGLRANFGSETKSLHAGQAAEGGLRAAMLAARGFSANTGLFDAADGFFSAYGANPGPHPVPADGGLEIDISGIGIKPYACCGAGLSLIDVMLDLHAQGLPPMQEVSRVDCAVTDQACRIMPLERARNGLEAKYCLAYCAAVAFLDGRAGLAQFEDARVVRDDVQDLMRRVHVHAEPHLATGGNRFGVELRITCLDGTELYAEAELPRGHPLRPLPEPLLRRKFTDCITPVLGPARAEPVVRAVAGLEDLPDIRQLTELLIL